MKSQKVKLSNVKQAVHPKKSFGLNRKSWTQKINSGIDMTAVPKLYQADELEIATEYEHALEANSLESIILLLDKVLQGRKGN